MGEQTGVERVARVGDRQGDLVDERGCALNELADDERQHAADDDDAAQHDGCDGRTTRQSTPVQDVDERQQHRRHHRRQQHRHHDHLEPRHQPQQRAQRREDDQQPPRPRGGLADDRVYRRVGLGIERASWHPGSVTTRRHRLWQPPRAGVRRTLICVSELVASPCRTRGRYWWLRWVVIGIAIAVLAVEVVLVWDQLAKAWRSLLSANWWWVLAAIVAAVASMHSFAQIQRTLLRSAGVVVQQWRSEAAFYAGNALSTTMPGGPVLSATFVYRQQRIWGASPVVASWQLVMSGALQVVGLGLLGLGGAFLLGASKNPLSLIFTLGVSSRCCCWRRPWPRTRSRSTASGCGCCHGSTPCAASASTPAWTKWRETLAQLESVSLSRRALGTAFSWSLFNWIADVACLAFAAYAAGGHPSLAGLTVAYAAARAVGSIPLMPGGPARRRGRAGPRPGVQRDDAGVGDLRDAGLPVGQLDLHLRDRLGGVLLRLPHRDGRRSGRRSPAGSGHAPSSVPIPRPRHSTAPTVPSNQLFAACASPLGGEKPSRQLHFRHAPADPAAGARRADHAACSPASWRHPFPCPPPTASCTSPTSCS